MAFYILYLPLFHVSHFQHPVRSAMKNAILIQQSRPSVCPSHASIVSKQLSRSSNNRDRFSGLTQYQRVTDRRTDGWTKLLYQYRALYSCANTQEKWRPSTDYYKQIINLNFVRGAGTSWILRGQQFSLNCRVYVTVWDKFRPTCWRKYDVALG